MCEKRKQSCLLLLFRSLHQQSVRSTASSTRAATLLVFAHSFLDATLDDMPNFAQNPHEAPPPDYGLECFLPARQPLVVNDFLISHEEAAQRLLAIWQAQNALDRQEWDAHLEADAQAAQ